MVYQTGILYYKNRAGEKVGPVLPDSEYGEQFLTLDGEVCWYGPKFHDGSASGRTNSQRELPTDLIEPWSDEIDSNIPQMPFNAKFGDEKVTEKKLKYKQTIQTGDYGIVYIQTDEDGDCQVTIEENYYSYQDLIDASETLKELAEFIKK